MAEAGTWQPEFIIISSDRKTAMGAKMKSG
jgi:hypothetical protein